jgi:hypothetical protein
MGRDNPGWSIWVTRILIGVKCPELDFEFWVGSSSDKEYYERIIKTH